MGSGKRSLRQEKHHNINYDSPRVLQGQTATSSLTEERFEGLRNVNAAEHIFWGMIPNRSGTGFMHKALQHKIMAALLKAFRTYNIEGLYVQQNICLSWEKTVEII